MTNLTLSIDAETLRRARLRAMRQGTSINALVREYITQLAGESPAEHAVAEFLSAAEAAGADSGGRDWSRDDLHER